MSLGPQKPPVSSALASRPTMLFVMPACAAEIWSPCRALVVLGTLASSLRDKWDSIPLQSDVEARRKSLRKISARTSTSILPSMIPQPYCSVGEGPGETAKPPPVYSLGAL